MSTTRVPCGDGTVTGLETRKRLSTSTVSDGTESGNSLEATSTIVSRQGSATCYQIVLRKNLNSYHRVNYIPAQKGLSGPLANGNKWAK